MKLNLNLDNVQEAKPVPNGRYDVLITTAESGSSKNGAPQIKVSLVIEGHIEAPSVMHYISLPGQEDEPGKAMFKQLMLKRFLTAFHVPFDASGFDVDDFLGSKACLELTLSEPDDSGNVYNRLQLPKLPTESTGDSLHKITSAKPPKR